MLRPKNSPCLARSNWSIGVDVVDVARFRRLTERGSARFLERTFTPKEIKYCMSFGDPAPHFAANFAAKEAVYKAMSSFRDVRIKNVEVLRGRNGAPRIGLFLDDKRKGESELCRRDKIPKVKVSLSHSASQAIAFAVAGDSEEIVSNVKLPKNIGVHS